MTEDELELDEPRLDLPPTVSAQVMEKYLNGMGAPSVHDDDEGYDLTVQFNPTVAAVASLCVTRGRR